VIFSSVCVDLDIFFQGDSAKEIDFKGNMILDEFFQAIADSNNIAFLDEFS
jgi:hypothetical protein